PPQKKKVTQVSLGKVISIDIGRHNIHLVVGHQKNNSVEVEDVYSLTTPEGAVKEGNLIDRSAVAFVINNAIKEYKINVKKAIISVKSNAVITRELTIPEVPEKDLVPLVLLDMEQYVPNIANDYRLGLTILDKPNGNNGLQKVRLFAMTNTMADNYAGLLKECNLKPVALDAHANAVQKMMAASYQAGNNQADKWDWNIAAVVDLGYELTEVSVMNSEKLLFNRLIPYGSSFLDAELMRQLNIPDNTLPLKKMDLGDLTKQTYDSEEAKRFNDILRLYISRVTNEIQTVLQFYSGRSEEKRPNIIYIYGGNALLKGIAATIETALNIPVRILDESPAINSKLKHDTLNLTHYVNACAALFRID
ncbi:MAG: type IV pilus assembly protein PilM, partial [Eubacteriales bacterium]|nr:type IV pilus assembly protein PilM [Eubacteriales bacterium]